MKEIKNHVDVLKEKAKKLEEGKVEPFRVRVVEHYFESLHEAIKGINLIIKKIAEDDKIEKGELQKMYKELEEFYKEKLDYHKKIADVEIDNRCG